MNNQNLFSFGHGYSAQAVGNRLVGLDWRLTCTTRSLEKAKKFDGDNIMPLVLPDSPIAKPLAAASHLLVSASPNADGDPMLAQYSDELRGAAQNLKWIGYLSTTGVYGNHDGSWVDETSATRPTTLRGQWRVKAEKQWQDYADNHDIPLFIFRLAGIYGPNRGPFEKVRSGNAQKIIKPGQVFSRIHVEDIANAVVQAISRPEHSGIYNICDDLAAPPEDVIGCAADLLGLEQPPEVFFETAELSPMARSFYSENKRVRNQKMKDLLGVKLSYPDYKSGLKALVKTL